MTGGASDSRRCIDHGFPRTGSTEYNSVMTFQMGPGSRLGPYVAVSELGRGGMAQVVLARDERLDRMVALKLLSPTLAEDPDFRTRFLREAKIAAAIEHPNIVPVYDAGELEGVLFIAMRYVAGTDLRRKLEKAVPPAEESLAILEQVAGALDVAHAAGLVHRDVKPGNVLLGETNVPYDAPFAYLADFGVAWQTIAAGERTKPGTLFGTTDYMAPEQLIGRPVDARSDVYALGCVLFECLTGEPPFRRPTAIATATAHLQEPPPRPSQTRSSVPGAMDAVVAQALAKDRGDRFGSCRALIASAREAMHGATAPSEFVSTRRGELPLPLTSFIGRGQELSSLLDLLSNSRLVTLIGPGGAGKTRLSVEVARKLQHTHDVAFVELSTVGEGTTQEAILAALPDDPGARLPSPRGEPPRILLVIDDCERLVDEVRTALVPVLESRREMVALATSREPLRAPGEITFSVMPLEVPGEGALTDPLDSPSGQLFWQRARSADPTLRPTPEAIDAVRSICRTLDGIPLALELAASCARSLTLPEIAARIPESPDLPSDPSAADRRRTMSAVVAWSYDLLDPNERIVFRRLSCFVGGFGIDDAEAVCEGDPIGRDDVAPTLLHLVDRSLVVLRRDDRKAHYRLLGPIARFARSRLAETGELATVRRQHALRFLGYLIDRDQGPDTGERSRAEAAHALGWLVEQRRDSVDVDEALLQLGGRAAVELGEWDHAILLLDPHGDDPVILEALGVALCKRHPAEEAAFADGQRLLERAYEAGGDVEVLAALAGTWRGVDDERAAALYRQAVDLDPSDPYALGNLIELASISSGRVTIERVPESDIRRAIARSRADITGGRNLPWARFDEAKLLGLLGEGSASLEAYLLALRITIAEHPLRTSLRSVGHLARLEGGDQTFAPAERLLQLALAARFGDESALPEPSASASGPDIRPPVLIVAGDSREESHVDTMAREESLVASLSGFAGTLISGGTSGGVSALVGDVSERLPRGKAIGYTPASLPPGVEADEDARRYLLRRTVGETFGPWEPLTYWTDLMAARIPPSSVTLLGIGGGEIASFEYRLALALGAWVAVIRETGRSAERVLSDATWGSASRLFEVPGNVVDLKEFFGRTGVIDQGTEEVPEGDPLLPTQRTFVFTDIVGSTMLTEAIGDEAWAVLRGWHDRTLRAGFARHEGEEIDHAGDGFFVAFVDPASAIGCAIEIQRQLAQHRRTEGFAPAVRIGVHATEALRTQERYGGHGVHIAARIAALAGGGEILTSSSTAALVEGLSSVSVREVELKGIRQPIEVVTVQWS